ncbi:MAG: hypothetical protein JWM46_227 [Candidatus Kaiserbacteria bacterium]|nr:hypothetical protein [Candidatus Kaiserbacteria bacterium]
MGIEGKKINRRDLLKGASALAITASLGGDTLTGMNEGLANDAEKRSKTPLERAFGDELVIGGETTEVIDIQPESPSTRPLTLVAPGFNASIHTNSPMLEMLADNDRRVLSLNQPREASEIGNLSLNEWEKIASFPRSELQKASNLLELLDKKDVSEKVNVLAFSEGALNTLLAAYLRPEKFNSIVLSAPAGLIGSDNLISLALRYRSQAQTDNSIGIPSRKDFVSQFPELAAQEQAMIDHIAAAWKDDEVEAGKHKLASIKDLLALSTMQIDDLVAFARTAGIKVAVIAGVDDQAFPAETMAKRLPKDSLDGFLSVRAAHGPQYSARIVNYLFDLLNAKREKEARANTSH